MKYLLLSLLTLSSVNAAEITIHSTSVYMIMLFLVLALIIMFAYFNNKCEKYEKTIKEQKEKIKAFEKQNIADDKETLIKQQAVEKEIILLNHTISDLERQLKEGSKHQIVAKIEALQQKRQNNTTV
jgi:Tfp pilus assembly protein PilO